MKTVQKYLLVISLALAISFLFFHNQSFAQDDGNSLMIGKQVGIHSTVLNEDRIVWVYLPDSYHFDSVSYPVIYLLDGGFHFLHTAGIIQFLSSNGRIPNAILIAVTNVDRTRDFSTSTVENIARSGGAEKFHGFLSDELMPMINTTYRTAPYQILVGHSLGGLYAAWSLIEHPKTFQAYIAISPYLLYDDEMVIELAEKKLSPKLLQGKSFYMTLGDEPAYYQAVDKFISVLKKQKATNFQFDYVHMEEEDHGSIPHMSIYNGLEFIFSDWMLPTEVYAKGLTAIDRHYKEASKKYGHQYAASEAMINQLGYQYLQTDNMVEGIKVFKENVKRYPSSANVYDSLGEAYEKNNQLKQAEKNYTMAVKLALPISHINLEAYQTNLKRVQNLLDNGLSD